ncbi:MAG: ABC transporter substrate-binding protein [Planctomycetota bacterium]
MPRAVLFPLVLLSAALSACHRESAAAAGPAPARIASVTLATDEMLAHLVDPSRVVAVTTYADDPSLSNAAGRYPESILRIAGADLEVVVALEPDLLLVSEHNEADFLELVRRTGIPTLAVSAHRSFADVRRTYLELGRAVGEPARAAAVAEWMDAELAALAAKLADLPRRPRVLYWAGGMSSGPRTTVGELIERAGGRNVAAELGLEGSAEVATERAIAADPDHVLVSVWSLAAAEGYTSLPAGFAGLAAVRGGRVIELPGRLLDCLSAHLVEGVWRLAAVLHPARIEAADLARAAAGPPVR